jgi:hypothetical protein
MCQVDTYRSLFDTYRSLSLTTRKRDPLQRKRDRLQRKRDTLQRKRDPLQSFQRKTRPTSAVTHLITHKTALCIRKRDLLMYAQEAYWYTGNRQAHWQPRHIHKRKHTRTRNSRKTYWMNVSFPSDLHMMLNSAMSIFCTSSSWFFFGIRGACVSNIFSLVLETPKKN